MVPTRSGLRSLIAYGNSLERSSVRTENSKEGAGVYRGGGAIPCARDRRKHRHFHSPRSNSAAASAGQRAEATGAAQHDGFSLCTQLAPEPPFVSTVYLVP